MSRTAAPAPAETSPEAVAPEENERTPELQQHQGHMKRKGQARLVIFLGAIILQVVLMPVLGGANGALTAFAVAAVAFILVHKFYDY